jgi:hypothetical protein
MPAVVRQVSVRRLPHHLRGAVDHLILRLAGATGGRVMRSGRRAGARVIVERRQLVQAAEAGEHRRVDEAAAGELDQATFSPKRPSPSVPTTTWSLGGVTLPARRRLRR